MLIDTQSHVFPEVYGEFLKKHIKDIQTECVDDKMIFHYDAGMKLVIDRRLYRMESFLETMDRGGVDISMISCNIPDPGALPEEYAAEACIMINDEIKSWMDAKPDRFRGIASIPWHLPQEAVKELRRVKTMGFKGVQLLTQNAGHYSDDPLLETVYAECEALELPIFIHPTAPTWRDATAAYNMTVTVGFPIDSSLTAIRLVHGGILNRYPRLRFHLPHAAGVLPWLSGRLAYHPRGVPKPAFADGKNITDYLFGEQFYFDICNPSVRILQMFRDFVGCDRVMFATDYPFLDAGYFNELWKEISYTPEESEKIRWENANRFYQLGL